MRTLYFLSVAHCADKIRKVSIAWYWVMSSLFQHQLFLRDEEGNAASGRPDRDPNEEPPAKRFKEDDSPDSNEGNK